MKDVQDLEAMFADAGFSAFARKLSHEALDLWSKDLMKK